jgi:predicted ATPase/DNA-binding winged helix-turn-helix (wHTH) protein
VDPAATQEGMTRTLPYRFGRFDLLPVERHLRSDGRVLPLGARAFDVLLALAERGGGLASKAELLDEAWPGLVVEEANLTVQIAALRKLLGAEAIATIPGLGYRLALREEGPAAPQVAAPAATTSIPRHNLPPETEPLIGRDAELLAIGDLLDRCRLVTLLGSGGVGKTALARAAAHRRTARMHDGVWWVDLAALATPDAVPPAIARVAGVELAGGDAAARLARALAGRELLLVVDNCEHLAAGLAEVVHAMLDGAAGVRVLATSQHALRCRGEQLVVVEPLALPADDAAPDVVRAAASVQLLERRMRAADLRLTITESCLEHAAGICRRLDGIALAIEMAAARVPLLGLAGVHRRLTDRLDLLRMPTGDAPSRQQTLRAALDWSCALLAEPERVLLGRLATFAGSFGLDAALAIQADTADEIGAIDRLAALVDWSLVRLDMVDPPRYRVDETTRLYAVERLSAGSEAASRRHGDVMAAIALRAQDAQELDEDEWLRVHAAEHDDIAAAFGRAAARGDAGTAAATVGFLRKIDQLRGILAPSTARVAPAYRLMQGEGARPIDAARLASFIASCSWVAMDGRPRLEMARRAAALWRPLGDHFELHHALARLASEAASGGLLDEAAEALAEAAALESPGWPPRARAILAYHAGYVAYALGDAAAYRAHMERARDGFHEGGAPRFAALAAHFVASAALMAGDISAAVALAEDAVRSFRALRQPAYLGNALGTLCNARLLAGDVAGARTAARDAWPLLERNGLGQLLLDDLAMLAAADGRFDDAALLLGQADRRHGVADVGRQPSEDLIADRAAAAIGAAIGSEQFARLRADGAALAEGPSEALVLGLISTTGLAVP